MRIFTDWTDDVRVGVYETKTEINRIKTAVQME